jgi:hypothetical protein
VRKNIELWRSTAKTLRGVVRFGEENIGLATVKNVRVLGRGRKQRVMWKGRRVKGVFRIEGKVGALEDDLFVRGRKGPMRAFSCTLLRQYEKHGTAMHLEKPPQSGWTRSLGGWCRWGCGRWGCEGLACGAGCKPAHHIGLACGAGRRPAHRWPCIRWGLRLLLIVNWVEGLACFFRPLPGLRIHGYRFR